MEEKRNVLVVEDDPDNQFMMREVLSRMHCHIEVASCGAEAIQMAGWKKFDFYFVDIVMPDMDGFEAIRGMQLGNDLSKVIITSANINPVNLQRARQMGIQKFMSKPIKLSEIESLFDEKDIPHLE